MMAYKAEGRTNKAVAEKFGVSEAVATRVCRGIASQKHKFSEAQKEKFRKLLIQNCVKKNTDDNVINIINLRLENIEYAGNYTGTDGTADLRCKKCGNVFTRSWVTIRHGKARCDKCEKARIQEQRDIKQAIKIDREKRLKDDKRKREEKIEKARFLRYVEKTHLCPVCGGITSNRIYCSSECSKKAQNKTREMRRRVRIENALIDKDITLERLYKKSNGICGICGGKCDYNDCQDNGGFFITGNNYPTIDHIVPLARGGCHSWDNIQLAHFYCNTAKGARVNG